MNARPEQVTSRIAVILNPGSGSVDDTDSIDQLIAEALPGAQVFIGNGPGDAARDARRAQTEGYDIVVAAGGDGTLNEVLNGCMDAGGPVCLGLLPLGTGNDFARTLEIPFEPKAALEVLAQGHRRLNDVVRITGQHGARYMINVAAGGFAGIVNEKLTPELKAKWGPLSYVRGLVGALSDRVIYATQLSIDSGPPIEESLVNVVVANARHVARGIPIAPTAHPNDGQLHLVAIREASLAKLALLTPEIMAGTHLDNAEILHIQARHLTISSDPPMTFNSDGEVFGETPLTFDLLPHAVSFIVPKT